MSDWKKKMNDILSAEKAPTSDELEEALAGALTERKTLHAELSRVTDERNQLQGIANNLAAWLNALATAHIEKDAWAVKDIMDTYVQTATLCTSMVTASRTNLPPQ